MKENFKRDSIPAEIKREILIESRHRCAVCGAATPLEYAHIIPWCKSKEHKVENLICLCANCHERADKEKWGEKTLREYKKKPFALLKHFEKEGKVINKLSEIELTIAMELKDFDDKNQKWLQYAIAAFLEIDPNAVQINSIIESSVKVIIELPKYSAIKLLYAYKTNDPKLIKQLLPLILSNLHTIKDQHQRTKEEVTKIKDSEDEEFIDSFFYKAATGESSYPKKIWSSIRHSKYYIDIYQNTKDALLSTIRLYSDKPLGTGTLVLKSGNKIIKIYPFENITKKMKPFLFEGSLSSINEINFYIK